MAETKNYEYSIKKLKNYVVKAEEKRIALLEEATKITNLGMSINAAFYSDAVRLFDTLIDIFKSLLVVGITSFIASFAIPNLVNLDYIHYGTLALIVSSVIILVILLFLRFRLSHPYFKYLITISKYKNILLKFNQEKMGQLIKETEQLVRKLEEKLKK